MKIVLLHNYFHPYFQMKKRTIERKSKDGFLNSMAKNLGLKPKEEQKTETVREFDDLIETLRTGEKVMFAF